MLRKHYRAIGTVKSAYKKVAVAWGVLLVSVFVATAWATEPFPPTKVYQKDGLWKVDYLSGSYIGVYYEGDQLPRYRFGIEFDLPREEYEKYVFETSAGPDWAPRAIHYFITIDGKPHFCARTWWGRRILINLTDLKHVSDAPYEKVLRAEEDRWILKTLAGAVTNLPAGDDVQERREIERVLTAVYQAGRMQITKAVPLLRQLEKSEYIGGGGGIMSNYGLHEGDIHPLQRSIYTIRQMVQRTLRGLGERPREDLLATRLHYLAMKPNFKGKLALDTGPPYRPKKYTTSRHQRAVQLRQGMRPVEVLDILGPPDELVSRNNQWRYDIDAEMPYSLLVTWKDYRIAAKIEKVQPLWYRSDQFNEHAKPVGWKPGSK